MAWSRKRTSVPLLFVAAAVLATWLPARRALDLNPVETLRDA
jgi:ABC-type lipoprotein release transport system permease subunit